MDPTRKPRIGISGSYGGLNLGDEAILESIVEYLRDELGAELVVFSRDPDDTKRRHGIEAVPVRKMTKDESRAVVDRLDLLIFGGGGILYDEEAQLYLREVELAHELGVPVMVYAISAGPLKDPHNRLAVRRALNRCAAITVRDRHGERLLQDVGVDAPMLLTADPALLLKPRDLPKDALRVEGIEGKQRLIALSVREPGPAAPDLDVDHYHALVANAADFVVDRYDADVVFIPMERKQVDIQHSHAIAAKMKRAARAAVLKGDYDAGQLLSLMARFDFAIGMRLHFLIFAALRGTPFAALPYASKVSGLLEDLDLDTPPMGSIGIGQLIGRIDRKWDTREAIRTTLNARVPALRERAKLPNRSLVELLSRTQVTAKH